MSEPASSIGGGIALAKWLWPAAKILGIPAAGFLGALIVAACDPAEAVPDPIKRRKLIRAQYISGITVAWLFTPGTVTWVDHAFDWFNPVTPMDWLEVGLPIGFIYGALAIGFIGALVKLKTLIAERGAGVIAGKVGLDSGESK
jgi:hypothetical protein